eukprot:3586232-Prymnesium_polylepis.1
MHAPSPRTLTKPKKSVRAEIVSTLYIITNGGVVHLGSCPVIRWEKSAKPTFAKGGRRPFLHARPRPVLENYGRYKRHMGFGQTVEMPHSPPT